jgi:hypothetical protein
MTNSAAGELPPAPPVGSGAGNLEGTTPMLAMLRDFGEAWSIQELEDGAGWVAVERPKPREPQVISAADLTELRKKLNASTPRLQF